MSASNQPLKFRPNAMTRRELRPPAFGKQQASSLHAMSSRPRPVRIAMIGNHVPRQCAIATFTTDLCDAFASEFGTPGVFVVAVNDSQTGYSYPLRVRFEINQDDIASYRAAAHFLNSSSVGLVCLQHEYGIYGGEAGSLVLELLRRLKMPVATTLHTVLREPDAAQRAVMQEIAWRSDRLIVMSEHSSGLLQQVFGVPAEMVDVIPHGIPNLPFAEPGLYKDLFSNRGKTVLLTLGFLSPNKGFENVIRAMPCILSRHKDTIYVIAGASDPHIRFLESDQYRLQLEGLAKELGVEENVVFLNRFLSPKEMASMVGSADIYITPYCREAQAVSGTLAYALGAGKAIISTPYWHAAELLGDGRGVLVPFEDPLAIAAATIKLLDNPGASLAMRERAYLYARPMVWNRVAESYMAAFVRAVTNRTQRSSSSFSLHVVEQNGANLPANIGTCSGADYRSESAGLAEPISPAELAPHAALDQSTSQRSIKPNAMLCSVLLLTPPSSAELPTGGQSKAATEGHLKTPTLRG